ncbi:hypothetical protein ACLB2K_026190 [Fragaria x ananassa]
MADEQSINDINPEQVVNDVSPVSLNQESSQTEGSRKRKRVHETDKLVVALEKVFEESRKRMQMVTEAILKSNEDCSDIAKELKNMGLSVDDQIAALGIILERPQNISIFKSLDDDVRRAEQDKRSAVIRAQPPSKKALISHLNSHRSLISTPSLICRERSKRDLRGREKSSVAALLVVAPSPSPSPSRPPSSINHHSHQSPQKQTPDLVKETTATATEGDRAAAVVHESPVWTWTYLLELVPRERGGSATVEAKNVNRRKQLSPVVFYGSPNGVPPKRPSRLLLRVLREIRVDLTAQKRLSSRVPCHLYFDLEFNKKDNTDRNGDEMVDLLISVVFEALLENCGGLVEDLETVLGLLCLCCSGGDGGDSGEMEKLDDGKGRVVCLVIEVAMEFIFTSKDVHLGIPEQIGDKSCGYFIMLYMREIVQDKEQNWTKKWLTRGVEKYTMQDVDVVRQEWAEVGAGCAIIG